MRDLLGGPGVKNLPSNTGDASFVPGQGTKTPHASGQVRPYAIARKSLHATVKTQHGKKTKNRENGSCSWQAVIFASDIVAIDVVTVIREDRTPGVDGSQRFWESPPSQVMNETTEAIRLLKE